MRLGYGSAAVELLVRYFEGQLTPISELEVDELTENSPVRVIDATEASLLEENINLRTDLPPLLVPLRERQPEKLHYLGASFGLTLDLFRFWRKHNFTPFYISPVPSNVTGEHSCMVLKPLNNGDIETSGSDTLGFFSPFSEELRKDFTKLLARTFCRMDYKLAMSILDPKINFSEVDLSSSSGFINSISGILSPLAMERLEAYTNNLVDYRMTAAFVDDLARAYFCQKIPATLSYAQASVLLCIGLQGKDISCIEVEMKLERQQIMSLYIKVMKKFYKLLRDLASNEIHSSVPHLRDIAMEPHPVSLEEELNAAAKQVEDEMKAKADGMMNPDRLQQYVIVEKEVDFENALQNGGGKALCGGHFSVKSSRSKIESKMRKKNKQARGGSKTNKKIKSN